MIGFLFGIVFYTLAFFISLLILKKIRVLNTNIFNVMCYCIIGHYAATYLYSTLSSDSYYRYFIVANNDKVGHGTQFVQWMVWHIRENITGDSYLGTLYFFSAFAYLGSTLWYSLYSKLVGWLRISHNRNDLVPMLVLMCWPTFIFFTNAIGKDSLCFFFIPIAVYMFGRIFQKKGNLIINITVLLFVLFGITILRPYLLMIFIAAFLVSNITSIKKIKVSQVLILIITIPILLFCAETIIKDKTPIENITFDSVSDRAVFQQAHQSKGTSFPMPSKNPLVSVLCLPYSFVMNLIMPLFVFAGNVQGIFASIENVYLLYLLFNLWKSRRIFSRSRKNSQYIRFMFCFFMIGMSFMALINTNLGLSTRQKSMYLPSLLVIMMMIRDIKKQQTLDRYENSNHCQLLSISP